MLDKLRYNKKLHLIFPLVVFLVFSSGAVLQDLNKKENRVEIKSNPDTEREKLTEEGTETTDTVRIGAYIFSVYDLDFPGKKVNVDFYLWYNARRDSIDMLEYLEVINATGYNKSGETTENRGEELYQTVRINSTIKSEWDVTHFPFDRQVVEIMIEDYDKDNSKLIMIADTIGSKIDKGVHIDGWQIREFSIKVYDHVYETNYGDPDIPLDEFAAYSRAVVSFTIEREGKGLFFKLFVGLFISVLISLLTFFINPLDLDPRFGLSVGAIFAAIASQYVISSTLPQNERLTLVDILHDISFIYIFICILVSTISLNYMKADKVKESQTLDKYSLYICASTYLILVFYFVIKALN
jgi:hypothetical protein